KRAAREREQCALRDYPADEVAGSSAEGSADSDLTTPSGSPDQQEIANVDARDDEEQRDRGREADQQRAYVTQHRLAERAHLGRRDVRWYRTLRVEAPRERQKVRSRRHRRNARRQPSNDVHECTTQRSEGDPELRPGRVVEPRWRDTDHPV